MFNLPNFEKLDQVPLRLRPTQDPSRDTELGFLMWEKHLQTTLNSALKISSTHNPYQTVKGST